ncbi:MULTISPECIES: AtzH-like domain-containing protein [unclassified Curtobacterium]|uniref:AtzH-like domain-containing protein n=1 Tax=unclassified Curtobacterium TaxID=257496 RepID=UPI00226B1DBB|nr:MULTISPECIES: AtzH-like domain-containing protein [unclassified Curtobacterium]
MAERTRPEPTWPAGLRAAFDRYEAALAADDVAVLDASFEPGPDTIRGDAAGLLVGHDRISAFRSARGGIAARRIGRTELRVLTDDTVLVVATSHFTGGGQGLQTQLWRRSDRPDGPDRPGAQVGPGVWRIAAAHVTGRAAAVDRTMWRVVGDPLVPGTTRPDAPLAGVRVAVKDLFAVRGQVVGAGNPEYERGASVSVANAPAVQVLLDAGASVTGIARTDEFAYSIAGRNAHTGTPPNGAAPERMPGGSTSGAAAAVALGQADLALGTDTAGSVRVPASYQGLWGLRTTHGAVPREGLLPLAQTFDTVGWLARDAATLRAAAVVALGDPGPGSSDLLVADELMRTVDPATRAAFEAFLARTGRTVTTVELPPLDELAEVVRTVQAAEAWRNDGAWVTAHPGAIGPDVAARFAAAEVVTASTEQDARARLVTFRSAVRDVLAGGVLCLPTVPGPAPLRTADAAAVDRTRTATLQMTAVAGIAGAPAVSAPALTVDGAPVGVCLVGAPGSDVALVDLAVALVG